MIAKVRGSATYTATLRMNQSRTFSMSCTCPVGRTCKHCAAALIRISQLIEEAEEISDLELETATGATLPASIDAAIAEVCQSKELPAVFESIRALTDIIANYDLAGKMALALLYSLEDLKQSSAHPDTFSLVDIALATDKRINTRLDAFIRPRGYFWPLHSDVYTYVGVSERFRNSSRPPRRILCAALSFRRQPQYSETVLKIVLEEESMSMASGRRILRMKQCKRRRFPFANHIFLQNCVIKIT